MAIETGKQHEQTNQSEVRQRYNRLESQGTNLLFSREVKGVTLQELRQAYHEALLATIWGQRKNGGNVPSNADGSASDNSSVRFAHQALETVRRRHPNLPPVRIGEKQGQAVGSVFVDLTLLFLEKAFELFQKRLRPGKWRFAKEQSHLRLAEFDQYRYLKDLDAFLLTDVGETDPEATTDQRKNKRSKAQVDLEKVKSALATDYVIKPDITVERVEPSGAEKAFVKNKAGSRSGLVARYAWLRGHPGSNRDPLPVLHASISCKWTFRSDRAQNARSEALNLLRLRKGRAPHIVVVTAEPLPSRLNSIASGTGDIDCTYHICLYELESAVDRLHQENERTGGTGSKARHLAAERKILKRLVDGQRLRDISDLPLDLLV